MRKVKLQFFLTRNFRRLSAGSANPPFNLNEFHMLNISQKLYPTFQHVLILFAVSLTMVVPLLIGIGGNEKPLEKPLEKPIEKEITHRSINTFFPGNKLALQIRNPCHCRRRHRRKATAEKLTKKIVIFLAESLFGAGLIILVECCVMEMFPFLALMADIIKCTTTVAVAIMESIFGVGLIIAGGCMNQFSFLLFLASLIIGFGVGFIGSAALKFFNPASYRTRECGE